MNIYYKLSINLGIHTIAKGTYYLRFYFIYHIRSTTNLKSLALISLPVDTSVLTSYLLHRSCWSLSVLSARFFIFSESIIGCSGKYKLIDGIRGHVLVVKRHEFHEKPYQFIIRKYSICKMSAGKLKRDEILLLFDVDGTLTFPRSVIEPEFENFLYTKVKPEATIGIVGGSDLEKMFEQLNGKKILKEFDFVFPENGLVVIENGVEISKQNIVKHLGEQTLQRFINFVLCYLSQVELPIKRGTFIEFRNGMLNICPIGRQCTREERNMFAAYDGEHKVRQTMIDALKKEFADVDLQYSIGGQISFDVFPHGWDKTYSLRHIEANYKFKEIHFFGDKTDPGGNDHEIYIDHRTISHKVETPHDTQRILSEILGIK